MATPTLVPRIIPCFLVNGLCKPLVSILMSPWPTTSSALWMLFQTCPGLVTVRGLRPGLPLHENSTFLALRQPTLSSQQLRPLRDPVVVDSLTSRSSKCTSSNSTGAYVRQSGMFLLPSGLPSVNIIPEHSPIARNTAQDNGVLSVPCSQNLIAQGEGNFLCLYCTCLEGYVAAKIPVP